MVGGWVHEGAISEWPTHHTDGFRPMCAGRQGPPVVVEPLQASTPVPALGHAAPTDSARRTRADQGNPVVVQLIHQRDEAAGFVPGLRQKLTSFEQGPFGGG